MSKHFPRAEFPRGSYGIPTERGKLDRPFKLLAWYKKYTQRQTFIRYRLLQRLPVTTRT